MSTVKATARVTEHPAVQEVNYVCSCGASYKIQSTLSQKEMHVEVCSACHPFYTGEQKLIDTAGRVENFRRRYERKANTAKNAKAVSEPEKVSTTEKKEAAAGGAKKASSSKTREKKNK